MRIGFFVRLRPIPASRRAGRIGSPAAGGGQTAPRQPWFLLVSSSSSALRYCENTVTDDGKCSSCADLATGCFLTVVVECIFRRGRWGGDKRSAILFGQKIQIEARTGAKHGQGLGFKKRFVQRIGGCAPSCGWKANQATIGQNAHSAEPCIAAADRRAGQPP